MTRINLIQVSELTDQHLLAEHREIKRIPNVIASGKFSLTGIPEKYTMGTGHVKFFYNKLNFLYFRYLKLHNECLKRGFDVEYYGGAWQVGDGDYIPTDEAIEISQQRINEKIEAKPGFYRYYGKPLNS